MHRRLMAAAAQERTSARSPWDFRDWRWRLPQWTSWAIVLVVTGGLTLRYAYALLSRTNWQRQHPEGNWISQYYPRPNFQGNPLVRYDVGTNYNWGRNAPAQAMDRDHWSARWDTCLVVTADTSLDLRLTVDDSVTLFLDGSPRVHITKPGQKSATLNLRQGIRHLRFDFQEDVGSARLQLDGLNFDGTSSYSFHRPVLDGDQVHCE